MTNDTPSSQPPTIARGLWAALAIIALAAIVAPLLVVLNAPRVVVTDPVLAKITGPKRVVPKAELPAVEPVELAALPAATAREINAAVPFSTAPNPAARAFSLRASAADQARAIDCLAAATWYEAGDDAVGQRAVAQVIINRMRHPAFPKSICGVVFQGQERRTGCQFTFTCDGAMARTPSPAAWARARDIARMALNGTVYAKVGHSTHYHTDWVVPYWSASRDKVAEVNTHLFFRWTGWWGTPPAFRRSYAGAEPVIAKMARLSPAHAVAGAALDPAISGVDGVIDPASIPEAAVPKPVAAAEPDTFYVALDRKLGEDGFAALAIRTCGDRPYCKFLGWSDPRRVPSAGAQLTPAQLESMSFSYLRDSAQGYGRALWNCAEYKRPSPLQCMRRAVPAAPASSVGAGDPATAARRTAPPDGLAGVRRKGQFTPAPAASPSPSPAATPAD
ncbi:cell wall hydrolase [Sphingomonas turrisvirgatae]|uniref:SleB-like protein n=1 Tax=Sphingomonas turrisvirgatae TaxID=1888892 RepID=A0A1E3LZZ1_9SPHN|nr:cell wall hydrolase [Sphingomonas turrisvirgatae]ODP39341.1 SleB-like protein [Sphingomonas turrisvirgatae]